MYNSFRDCIDGSYLKKYGKVFYSVLFLGLLMLSFIGGARAETNGGFIPYSEYLKAKMKSKVFLSPKAGQVLRSVRVYSPDGKFNAYIETIKDSAIQKEGNNTGEWRRIVIDIGGNVQKELYRTKKGTNPYDQAILKIDDWTKDSRYLIFNRFYLEGGAYVYVYDTKNGKLLEIPETEELGSMGISSLGWHNGRLIFQEQGARNPEQYYWDKAANRLVMVKNKVKGPFFRYALVRKNDKEQIISASGKGK